MSFVVGAELIVSGWTPTGPRWRCSIPICPRGREPGLPFCRPCRARASAAKGWRDVLDAWCASAPGDEA